MTIHQFLPYNNRNYFKESESFFSLSCNKNFDTQCDTPHCHGGEKHEQNTSLTAVCILETIAHATLRKSSTYTIKREMKCHIPVHQYTYKKGNQIL